MVDAGLVDSAPEIAAETAPEQASGPIKMTFDPPSGSELPLDKPCITITFSRPPHYTDWAGGFNEKGNKALLPGELTFKDGKGTYCAFAFLKPGQRYDFGLDIKEQSGTQRFQQSATYKTNASIKQEDPFVAGLEVNMQVTEILGPRQLKSFVGEEAIKDIPPLLFRMHHRDKSKQGGLLWLGAVGTTPKGVAKNAGKDKLNTTNPGTFLLSGKFNGRWFGVESNRFFFNLFGIQTNLEDFRLTGLFTKDGKNVEGAKFSAVLDTKVIKDRLKLDPCTLLGSACFKDSQGRSLLRVSGRLKGIVNPFGYAVLMTSPSAQSTGVNTTTKADIFVTEKTAKDKLVATLYTCTGSRDKNRPCRGRGTKRTIVAAKGSFAADTVIAQRWSYTLPKLKAKTWYQLNIKGTNAKNVSFQTYVVFQTL